MPAVALGQTGWTPDEIRHLNECGSCRREWDLVQVASRLGDEAGLSLDSTAIAAGVARRLDRSRKDGRLRRRAWSFATLAAAAAVVAAIWAGDLESGPSKAPAVNTEVAGRLSIPLPELESLEPAELDSVLQTMDEPVVSGSNGDDPALGDLNSDELERVLDSWEG
jgi:hypothetical protein